MTYEEFEAAFSGKTQKEKKAFIEARHPFYSDKEDHWRFLESTYEGGREWFDKNIHRFHREGDKDYRDRVARAYRFNHTREVVDLVNKYIFKPDIVRRDADVDDVLADFWKHSTLSGKDMNEFMKLCSQRASIFGKAWAVVDTNYSGGVISKRDLKNGKYRPYVYMLSPIDMLDIAFDDDGTIAWAKVREYSRDDDTVLSSGKVVPRYRIWTKDFWALIVEKRNPKGEVVSYDIEDGGSNFLKEVPIVAIDHMIDENAYIGSSLIDDIAYLDRSVANYLSNLDEIIQDQTFSQLIIPFQAMMPPGALDDNGDDENARVVELGTKRVFTYDGQANSAPQYISPDPNQASLILKVIEKIINEIYHSTGLAGERTKQDNAMGIDNSSGVAKAFDFERMNAMLASKASSLQQAEMKILELVAKYIGATVPDDERSVVQYPKTFDVRSLYDEFEIAQRLALVDAPGSVRREQMNQVAEKLFNRLSTEDLRKMQADIAKDWLETENIEAGPNIQPPRLTNPDSKQGQNNTANEREVE